MSDTTQGPAFPVTAGQQVYSTGATLRDYFAAAALTGMIIDHGDDCSAYRDAVCARAWMVADAMLRERQS